MCHAAAPLAAAGHADAGSDDHHINVVVVTANAGHGGMAANGTYLFAEADALNADVVVVSEPYPLAKGVHDATARARPGSSHGDWVWITADDCRTDGRPSPQSQGNTSGGVVVLVRQVPRAADGLELEAHAHSTPAATQGDCVIVQIALRQRAVTTSGRKQTSSRTWHMVVAGLYLLPTSRTSGARALCPRDDACADDHCPHQHPMASLVSALTDLYKLTDDGTPALLTGDLNVHAVGPTSASRTGARGDSFPNDKQRRTAFLETLAAHDAAIVNGFVAGDRPVGLLPGDEQPTRRVRDGRSDPPATLDYAVALHEQAHCVTSCDVHEWGPHIPTGLDHDVLCTTVALHRAVEGCVYRPSTDVQRVAVNTDPRYIFSRLPSRDPAWKPVQQLLGPAVQQLKYDWYSVAGTGTAVPVAQDVPELLLWLKSEATKAMITAKLGRLVASRNKSSHKTTLEGQVATAARTVTRLSRRYAKQHNDTRRVPIQLHVELRFARFVRNKLLRQLSAERKEAASHDRRAMLNALSADGRRANPHEAGRLLSIVASTKRATSRLAAARVNSFRVNGATSRLWAAKEWYVWLRAQAQRRLDEASGVHRHIRDRFDALLRTEGAAQHQSVADATGDQPPFTARSVDPLNAAFTPHEMGAALRKARARAGTTGLPIGMYQALSLYTPPSATVVQSPGSACEATTSPSDAHDGDDTRPGASPAPGVLCMLAALANAFLLGAPLPDELVTLTVRPLHKRGDPQQFANWRLVTPGQSLLWILHHAFAARLSAHVEAAAATRCFRGHGSDDPCAAGVVPDFQSGFRPNHSTLENLVLSEELAARAAALGHAYCEIYCDSRTAFDSVPHNVVGVALHEHGVTGRFWRLLMTCLTSARLRVQLGGVTCVHTIPVTSGVLQGSPLGPQLYTVAASSLARAIQRAVGQSAAMWWTPSPAPAALPLAALGDGSSHRDARDIALAPGTHTGLVEGDSSPLPFPFPAMSSVHYADDFKVLLRCKTPSELSLAAHKGLGAVVKHFNDRAMSLNVKDSADKTAIAVFVPGADATQDATSTSPLSPPLQVDGRPVPVLAPNQPYKDLGLMRLVTPNTSGRQANRRGTAHHMATVVVPAQARALRGRVVAAGMHALHPRDAAMLYASYMMPALTYGMAVWVQTPSMVPQLARSLAGHNLITLCGRGAHTTVPTAMLEACFGVMPLWAYALRDAIGIACRVLQKHPRNGLRAAMREAARQPSGSRFCSWWTSLVTALSTGINDALNFQYILQDLQNKNDVHQHSEGDPQARASAGAGGPARRGDVAAQQHVWTTDDQHVTLPPAMADAAPPDWPTSGTRCKKYLLSRLFAIVHNARRHAWRCEDAHQPGAGFAYSTGASSGSSFHEVRSWLEWSSVLVPLPLLDSGRTPAFAWRVHALGGVGAVVDNRWLAAVRDAGKCLMTYCPSQHPVTLTHLLAVCPALDHQRQHAARQCKTVLREAHEKHHETGWDTLAATVDAVLAGGDDAANRDWTCVCLGVPLPRAPALAWELAWYSPTPTARSEQARQVRTGLLAATAELVAHALRELQRAAWRLPCDAPLPRSEQRRRDEARRQAARVQRGQQKYMMNTYFKAHDEL